MSDTKTAEGKTHKVNMQVTSNLRAYLEDTKFDKNGLAQTERTGGEEVGVSGTSNQDMKVKPGEDFASPAGKSYKINTLID